MKTECSIVRDLLPLYVEGMLAEQTEKYVSEHLEKCTECRHELDELREGEKESGEVCVEKAKPFKKIMGRINLQLYSFAYSLIILFIFLGFSWTAGSNMMYNSLIMPLVGIFAYYVFRWRALYKAPLLLVLIDLFVYVFQLVEINFPDTLTWTLIYSTFVLVGIIIAALVHFAFKREGEK